MSNIGKLLRDIVPETPETVISGNSRSDMICCEIRDMILRGDLPPGFHIQEVPIAKTLGVSRTPVHEALVILATEGLLEPGPKRGYKVRVFMMKDIEDAYDVRANLEGLAARLAAERGISREAEQRMKRYLEIGDQMMLRGRFTRQDHLDWLEMNNGFHLSLLEAAENTLLKEFVQNSHNVPMAGSRHIHWYRMDDNNYRNAVRAHQAHHDIYTAIVSREPQSAESLMREHIIFSKRQLRTYLQDRMVPFGDSVSPPS